MKKTIFTLLLLGAVYLGFGQTQINLKINHKLGNQNFAFNQKTSNNNGQEFNVSRLEYYVTGISFSHDQGQTTTPEKLYLLVNPAGATTYDLGSHNIQDLDSITFHIGVGPDENNEDPAQYALGHPLAPKTPSMHWGWAVGYRFVAFEGKSGSNLNALCELHALGNNNYFQITLPVSYTAQGNQIDIELNADYAQALFNIDLSGDLIVHGEEGEALDLLHNFKNLVFTNASGEGNVYAGVNTPVQNPHLKAYPNPSSGKVIITNKDWVKETLQIEIFNQKGQLIKSFEHHAESEIQLDAAGLYIIQSTASNGEVSHQKLIVY